MIRKLTLLFFISFLSCAGIAQMPSFKTSIDRSTIVIGQQFKLKLEVNIPHNTFTLQSLSIPDSIPHFEIVGKGKSDSVHSDDATYFSQILNITSFDSGLFVLPSFKLNFLSVDKGRVFSGLTDTFKINVTYSPIDSIQPFHDIHTIKNVKDEWELWMWLALIDAILLLIAIVLYILKRLKRKKKVELFASKLTPYDEAMKDISDLQSKKLLENGEVKQFHTSLVYIFKKFMSRRSSKNLTLLTSEETLILLHQNEVSKENISSIANTLRMADAVKFAKFQPLISESEQSLLQTKAVIESINHSTNEKEKIK